MFAAKTMHRLAVLSAFACALVLSGCGKKPDPTKTDEAPKKDGDPKLMPPDVTPKGTPPKLPSDLSNAKADVTYSVKEYSDNVRKSFHFLARNDAGKVVEVSGVVNGCGKRSDGIFLYLENGDAFQAFRIGGKDPWTKALPKQTVTIRTIPMEGHYEWQIVAVKGPPPATLTAEQLVKERDADGTAFQAKYGKVSIIVMGTISQLTSDAASLNVELEAGGGKKLNCVLFNPATATIPMTEEQKALLKPGVNVKLLGAEFGLSLRIICFLEPTP